MVTHTPTQFKASAQLPCGPAPIRENRAFKGAVVWSPMSLLQEKFFIGGIGRSLLSNAAAKPINWL
jgi:hypothetical protein